MPAPLGQQACAPHRTGGRRHPDLVRPTGPPRGSPGGRPARARTAPRRPRDGAVAQQHRLRHRLLRAAAPRRHSGACDAHPARARHRRTLPPRRARGLLRAGRGWWLRLPPTGRGDGSRAPLAARGGHRWRRRPARPRRARARDPGRRSAGMGRALARRHRAAPPGRRPPPPPPPDPPRPPAASASTSPASADLCGLDESTVYLAVLPVAHNFTLACPGVLGTLAQGGTVVLSRTANCDEAMPLIERERVTHLALVPPLAQLWVQAREWEDSDLSSLRLVQVGGSRLAPLLARRLPQALGCRLQQVFGMAEGLLCCTRLDDPEDAIIHTQGRPLSPQDEVRIVDEHDQDVPPGEVGQLLTRGPYTIRGYYRAPEHNAGSFTRDGYYRTGDLVRRDPAGNLIVEGRIKEQIQRGGEKISAAEVEFALGQLPGVRAAAVVGVPDDLCGARICAFVQPPGTP